MQAATSEATLIGQIPDPILFVDCALVIRLWNPGAETLFGHSAEDAIGRTLDLIVPESMRAAHWAGFSRAVQEAERVQTLSTFGSHTAPRCLSLAK